MMREKSYFLNTVLAVVTGVILLGAVLVRVFMPIVMIPSPGIPELTALSLLVLLIEHYLKKEGKRCYLCVFVLAAVTFGLLPWAAGFVALNELWKTALVGGAVFTAVTWIFTSMQERINSGKANKAVPVINAIGLYLAVQCFAGMFL